MAFDRATVAAAADDLDVASAELGGFEDRLPTSAAWGADRRVRAADHRDPRDLVEAELVLRGGERALLGAEDRKSVV